MPECPGHANPHERGVMNARRIAGSETPDSDSAIPSLDQTILALYPDLLRELPIGFVLLLLETTIPGGWPKAIRPGEVRDLGELSYGDERIQEGVYSVRVFPLSSNFLGVAFEDITDRKLAERILRDSEERFRLLVDGVQEYAIFQLDPMGHVASWNAGAARLKGYTSEEIIGKHFSVFYPQEDLLIDKPQNLVAKAARHGQSEDEGWRIRK